MINKIEGEYDEWISVQQIDPNYEIDPSVQQIYCDTRDFAIGWNFEQPQIYENDECGYERRSNKGIKNLRNLFTIDNRHNYTINENEIITWLNELCLRTGGYDKDWRFLSADVKDCQDWDIKYIRFVRNPHKTDEFIVCNNYMQPIHWKEIIPNLKSISD